MLGIIQAHGKTVPTSKISASIIIQEQRDPARQLLCINGRHLVKFLFKMLTIHYSTAEHSFDILYAIAIRIKLLPKERDKYVYLLLQGSSLNGKSMGR